MCLEKFEHMLESQIYTLDALLKNRGSLTEDEIQNILNVTFARMSHLVHDAFAEETHLSGGSTPSLAANSGNKRARTGNTPVTTPTRARSNTNVMYASRSISAGVAIGAVRTRSSPLSQVNSATREVSNTSSGESIEDSDEAVTSTTPTRPPRTPLGELPIPRMPALGSVTLATVDGVTSVVAFGAAYSAGDEDIAWEDLGKATDLRDASPVQSPACKKKRLPSGGTIGSRMYRGGSGSPGSAFL